jgi:4-nitrophenyl phosphatase
MLSDNTTAVDAAAGWLAQTRAIVLDMDGVLYRGDTLVPGVPEFLASLEAAGLRYAMATNNSTLSPAQYVAKLARMGVAVPETSVITSGVATATYLKGRFPRGTRVYVLGMAALEEAVYADGYFERAEQDVAVVVSGADFELTYAKLRIACLCIRAGAQYVATNADSTFPTEAGLIPGSGAIVAALRAATGVDPLVIGKPSTTLADACVELLGTRPEETVMLGDRLDTDILSGQRAGQRTVLVLTGVSTRQEVRDSGIVPDLIVETLAPLTEFFSQQARLSQSPA